MAIFQPCLMHLSTTFLILAFLGQGWWNYCFETPGTPHHHPSSPSYSTPHHHKFLPAVSRRRKAMIKKCQIVIFAVRAKLIQCHFKEAEYIIVMPPILWISQSFPGSPDRFREDTWYLTNTKTGGNKWKHTAEDRLKQFDFFSSVDIVKKIA